MYNFFYINCPRCTILSNLGAGLKKDFGKLDLGAVLLIYNKMKLQKVKIKVKSKKYHLKIGESILRTLTWSSMYTFFLAIVFSIQFCVHEYF